MWQPIAPLAEGHQTGSAVLDLESLMSLAKSFSDLKEELRDTPGLQRFQERVWRSFCVETGILEGLYDISRGTTQLLVEQGFNANLIQHGEASLSGVELVEILRDHQAAAGMVVDIVGHRRSLTKGWLRELHALLTRHQQSVKGVDPHGRIIDVPLSHGQWKMMPNNPTRPNGSVHFYAPPEQVESEMDRLLELHQAYSGVHPIIRSAWLHHRFTQIHPFQDGNGRVARALIQIPLLQENFPPLVIERDHRQRYILALESADMGDDADLIRLFFDLSKDRLLETLGTLKGEIEEKGPLDRMIPAIAKHVETRRISRRIDYLKVNEVAHDLCEEGVTALKAAIQRNRESLTKIAGGSFECQYEKGDGWDGGWRFDMVEVAKRSKGSWVNLKEGHFWIRIRWNEVSFCVSLHHIGSHLGGVAEATAFVVHRGRYSVVNLKPFPFTWRDQSKSLMPFFLSWLDESLLVAIKTWSEEIL